MVMIELIFILAVSVSGAVAATQGQRVHSGRSLGLRHPLVALPCQFPASPLSRENRFPARHCENADKSRAINGLSEKTQIFSLQFPRSRENATPASEACPLPAGRGTPSAANEGGG